MKASSTQHNSPDLRCERLSTGRKMTGEALFLVVAFDVSPEIPLVPVLASTAFLRTGQRGALTVVRPFVVVQQVSLGKGLAAQLTGMFWGPKSTNTLPSFCSVLQSILVIFHMIPG